MITVEEKLNTFSKMIIGKEKSNRDKKLLDISNKNDEIIEKHKKMLSLKREEIIKNKIKEANIKANEMISMVNNDRKNEILHKKKEYMNILIKDIWDKTLQFVEGEDYKEYLLSLIDKIINALDDNMTIYLNQRDISKYDSNIKNVIYNKNITIKPAIEDMIGGGIGISEDGRIRIDLTLKSIIDDNKDYIGQVLYTALEKGDIDG